MKDKRLEDIVKQNDVTLNISVYMFGIIQKYYTYGYIGSGGNSMFTIVTRSFKRGSISGRGYPLVTSLKIVVSNQNKNLKNIYLNMSYISIYTDRRK